MARSTKLSREVPVEPGEELADMLDHWRLRRLETKKAPGTVVIYVRAGKWLERFLKANNYPTGVNTITRDTIDSFVSWMNVQKKENGELLSGAYVSQVFRALVSFFKWLHEVEQEIDNNPMVGVERPKVTEPYVPVMQPEDMGRLLAACKGRSFEDVRDHAIVTILIDTGIRIGELASMRLDRIELGQYPAITVTGKTGTGKTKTRTIGIPDVTAEALMRYVRARKRHRMADQPELWLAIKGHTGGVMTEWGLRLAVKRRAKKAGLASGDWDRIYPHRFRHTFAHRWLVSGRSERDLMAHAGWKSPSMVARYTASAAEERAANVARASDMSDQIPR